MQAELASVFQKSWLVGCCSNLHKQPSWTTRERLVCALQLMGEASNLQQPGDFITSLVTDRPFVACVDQQGQLKAYHNVHSLAIRFPSTLVHEWPLPDEAQANVIQLGLFVGLPPPCCCCL